MTSISGEANRSPASSRRPRDPQASIVLRLSRENEVLREEVRQLRAAIHVYSELATRLDAQRQYEARDLRGTL
jgi:hypothetical protein